MDDYQRIADIIRFLQAHQSEQPSLARLAAASGLSPWHLQRLFARWAGVSPKDFLKALTLAHARRRLAAGESVFNSALDSGLSGPGRLHDLCIRLEAASPGEVKSGGHGWVIQAGIAPSPFGNCLLAEGPRGICHLSFPDSADRQAATDCLHRDWPAAELLWNDAAAASRAAEIFSPTPGTDHPGLRAYVRGSSFQLRVWRALLAIPPGALTSYGRLAAGLGQPGAARAVGSAVAANPVGYLIPCHRVIRESGVIGNYRWGEVRKQALIARETAASDQASGDGLRP